MKRAMSAWGRAVAALVPPGLRRRFAPTARYVDMLLLDMQALDAQWDLTNSDSYGSLMVADNQVGTIRAFVALDLDSMSSRRVATALQALTPWRLRRSRAALFTQMRCGTAAT